MNSSADVKNRPDGASPSDRWREYQAFLALARAEGLTVPPVAPSQDAHGPPALPARLLEYAGQVAWRNSNRCIGRLFWRALSVRDLRHLDNEQALFDALVEHLQIATNGGRIRPVLTVFRGCDPDGHGPRIVNHQLIRYAGYEQADGTILGDPQNRALTRAALAAGWQPPREPGAFDLLPVGIQWPGRPVRWFELPPDAVLQIRLRHPDFAWFEGLGLRWYAVPVITDMCFDAAGTRHGCAPFSGWYMGTEIGARNLADPHRYNLLPRIAQAMGLDTSNPAGLWKDRALVELNVAVLHSFASQGIMIVDHHTASEQFLRFMASEKQAGREATGNWSWLVPPVSGATSPLFHCPFDDREKKPAFRYK